MPGKSCPGFEGTSAVFLTWPLPSSAVAIGSKRTSACILGVTLPQGHEPSCQEKNLHGKEEQMKVTLYLAPRSAGSPASLPLLPGPQDLRPCPLLSSLCSLTRRHGERSREFTSFGLAHIEWHQVAHKSSSRQQTLNQSRQTAGEPSPKKEQVVSGFSYPLILPEFQSNKSFPLPGHCLMWSQVRDHLGSAQFNGAPLVVPRREQPGKVTKSPATPPVFLSN
jgi:hypothetical protein